jgi:cytochrome c-type biogenesis protein CcmE
MLIASQVLAKHDENYVPNEAADAIMLQQANKCEDTDGSIKY